MNHICFYLSCHDLCITQKKIPDRDTENFSQSIGGAGDEWLDYGWEQNSRQIILIRTITKQTLLCCIAIWSRIIVNIFILADEIVVDTFYHRITVIDIVRQILSVIAICLQILCIYVSYHFSSAMYQCCCSCCHKCYHDRIEKSAEKKLDKELSRKVSLNYFRL